MLAAASFLMLACSEPAPADDRRLPRGRAGWTRWSRSRGRCIRWPGQPGLPRARCRCSTGTGPRPPRRPESGERRGARAGDPSHQSEHHVFRRHQRRRLADQQRARRNPDLDAAHGHAAVAGIGGLALDRGNPEVVIAGTGKWSSFFRTAAGGLLLISQNGGDSWNVITDPLFTDQQISGVVIRGATLLVANRISGMGLARSTNGGATWTCDQRRRRQRTP